MCNIIYQCLSYSRKFNRILVIHTRKSNHFKDSIHKYIEISDPNIYTGTIETWYSNIESKTVYPEYIQSYINDITPRWTKTATVYHNTIGPLHFDLSKDYHQDILLYVRCGTGRSLHTFLSPYKLKEEHFYRIAI
jgi:hypothetical protein